MASLPPDDCRKLARILGMLGSDALGERAAAGLLATKLIKSHGLQWSDIIGGAVQAQQQRQPPPGQSGAHTRSNPATDLTLCRRHLGAVTPWEANFIDGLQNRRRLSEKQLAILQGIASDLRKRGMV